MRNVSAGAGKTMTEESRLDARTLRRARWIGAAGAALLRALSATWRLRVHGPEHEDACLSAGRGFIYALWHETLLTLICLRRDRGILALVSLSRDGEYIAQTVQRMGISTVRGSTTRGGLRALLAMADAGAAGRALAFTPDGPRGPRRSLQPGILVAAQRARIPILPISAAAHPCRRLSSWDRMILPAPFSRVVLAFGAPLEIPAAGSPQEIVERWTPLLADTLDRLGEFCEREARGAGSRGGGPGA